MTELSKGVAAAKRPWKLSAPWLGIQGDPVRGVGRSSACRRGTGGDGRLVCKSKNRLQGLDKPFERTAGGASR